MINMLKLLISSTFEYKFIHGFAIRAAVVSSSLGLHQDDVYPTGGRLGAGERCRPFSGDQSRRSTSNHIINSEKAIVTVIRKAFFVVRLPFIHPSQPAHVL